VVVSQPGDVPLPVDEPVRVLRADRRLHYGEAVNLGAAGCSGRWLLVLNDDTVARAGFVRALLDAARAFPDALLQPRILLSDASARLDNVGHGLFLDGHNQPVGRGRDDGATYDLPCSVGVVSGAAFLAPRERFLDLGGFDADLGPFGDDLDLSLRWVRGGGQLRYVPAARIEHELGASYGRASLHKVYLVERNRVRAGLRSLPVAALAGSPPATVLRWGLMAGAAAGGRGWGGQLPVGAGLAALAGALCGLHYLPQALGKRRRDAAGWELGERAMLRHVLDHRASVSSFFHRPAGDHVSDPSA